MSEQLSMDAGWNSRGVDEAHSRRFPFPWTDEKIEVLKLRIAEGKSAREVGLELGCSRSAVLGKMHRIKLKATPKPPGPKPRHSKLHPDREYKPITRQKRKPPMDIQQYQSSISEVVPLNIPFSEITDKQCRFICGEPDGANTLYCGHSTLDGWSWCGAHFRVLFPPRQRQIRKAA